MKPPLLSPAPPWQPERSEFVILWHGCTLFDKDVIESDGIDLTKCKVDSDFGHGFYTTTLERQARHWAWGRFFVWQKGHPGVTGNQPVILRFRLRRYGLAKAKKKLDKGLDKLLSLHFVRGDYNNEDFWSFVQHCRQSTPAAPNDHQRPPGGWYDLVTGSVAAFWEQREAMAGADQVSFHTKLGVDILNDLIKSRKRENYEWQIVS
jgi:hypothetical protein